jgi:hypothetical protein
VPQKMRSGKPRAVTGHFCEAPARVYRLPHPPES